MSTKNEYNIWKNFSTKGCEIKIVQKANYLQIYADAECVLGIFITSVLVLPSLYKNIEVLLSLDVI